MTQRAWHSLASGTSAAAAVPASSSIAATMKIVFRRMFG
jgi:hypothetical protein